MLHLVCGPSGSGKTARLAEMIRKNVEAGVPCILLVPEQQVYTSEREFPKSLPKNAGRYFEILSFTGLSEKIFRRFGGLQFSGTSQSVRSLIMWKVLRNLGSQLDGFANKSDAALTKLMLSAVEDLRINGILPEDLQAAAEVMPEHDPLKTKLENLMKVSLSYREQMETLFGDKVPEERLARMSRILSENRVFSDTEIYVDSFTSFTHDENKVLFELMKQAKNLTLTLCLDRLPSHWRHFKSISDTGNHLKTLAEKACVECETTCLTRRDDSSDLSYLEENLWNFSAPTYSGKASRIRLFTARNVYEECEAAAKNIAELASRGIRYGEIAVVVRDFETYHGWLDASLEKHGIPYFLSERNEFSKKPIARLVLSALRAAVSNYRAQDVLSILKTGLSGVSFQDASFFEEYVETWHISGKRFLDDEWKMNPDGMTVKEPTGRGKMILDAANRVRVQLIHPLQKLAGKLSAGSKNTFLHACEALYEYLIEIGLPDNLLARSKEELERGSVREAEEGVRLFGFLTELLGNAADVLGEEKLSADEFLAAVGLLFANSDLGSVPLVNNCVILGSASTLRLGDVKAMIVLGLCDGEFPGDVGEGGILTEADKEKLLDEYNVKFRSTAELKQAEELFYVYRTFTKPTECLILSAPSSIGSGSDAHPSIAFNRVKKLFDLPVEPADLPKRVAQSTRPQEKETCIASDPDKKTLGLSASSLETFASCPYSYHLTRTLGLREEADATQGAIESGNFLHHVFAEFLKEKSKDSAAFEAFVKSGQRDDATLEAIAREYIRQVCNCEPEALDPQLLHQFARMAEFAVAMLYGSGNDGILSDFRDGFFPTDLEVGVKHNFPTENRDQTVILRGQIDRIDQKEDADGLHLRVIDYKSSEHKFNSKDIITGKEIQMVLYLMVLLDSGKYKTCATAEGKYLWGESSDTEFSVKKDGIPKFELQAENRFSTYKADLEAAIQEKAEQIFRGDAQKTPSPDACKYCPLKKYCTVAYRSKY